MALPDLHRDITVAAPLNRGSRLAPLAAPATLLLVPLVVGFVVGLNPEVGILLILAILFTLVVTSNLALGVCGFLMLTFVDVLSADSDLSLTKAAGALLVGGWLARTSTHSTTRRELLSGERWLMVVVLAFIAWSGFSALWADEPSAAFSSTIRFALNAMLFPIVYVAIREQRHIVWVLAVFIIGTLASVAWGVTQSDITTSANAAEGRLAGATVEANALATLLMVSIVFAGALGFGLRRRVPLAAPLGLAAVVIGFLAFFATFSRGGFVGLAVIVLAGMVYGGRLRPALAALTLAALIIGAVFLSSNSSAAVERLTSKNTSGRSDIWTVGLRMVQTHPVLGVGSGNFTVVEADYLIFPGAIRRDDLILDKPLVAHNIYLHVLAEMGVIGLALFIGLFLLSLNCARRAVAIFKRRRQRSLEILGRAIVVAILGMLAADFFASEQYNKQLWLLLALCPALLAIAHRTPEPSAPASVDH